MEHRLEERVETDLEVVIYENGQPVGIGKVANISSSGAYVHSRYSPNNCQYARIALIEKLYDGNNDHILGGLVIHSDTYGFGLMLDEKDSVSDNIKKWLQ